MADGWYVVIFGDSWAAYAHPTWPEVLGRRLGARVFNYALPGGVSADLNAQCQRMAMSQQVPRAAMGKTIAIIHTGGNDFIGKMMPVVMGGMMGGGGGVQNMEIMQPNPGAREAGMLKDFMETLHRQGIRHLFVSGVPAFIHLPIFNMVWPITAQLTNSGALEGLGVSPGDPPSLCMEVQSTALNERWSETVDTFAKAHADSTCVYFDEVEALDVLRGRLGETNFDRQMWDFSMFHPSVFGHEQIAGEARTRILAAIPALSGGDAAGFTPPARAPAAPAALVPAPAAAAPQSSPPTAAPAAASAGEEIRVNLRNVKGDVSFSLTCGARIAVPAFREAIIAAAPPGFAGPGMKCTLVFKGKILADVGNIADVGVVDSAQVIVVMKPA